MKKNNVYKIIMLVILTVAITFIITSIVMYNTLGKNNVKYVSTDSIGRTFKTFHDFIEKNYLGEINEDEMLESAIKGYVAGLNDEYSEYITKEEMEEYMQDATGKYVGIGVYIANNTKTNQIVVLMPIKGSPAEEAGIKSGDVITKVDGVAYKGEQLSEASSALKKEEGTKVKVEILRESGETVELEIERRNIKVNHIETKVLNDNIGYMEISTFDDGCYEEFKTKWEDLKNQNIKSLIIDLRNNGGGIVKEATDIADMMVEKGETLLITTSKNKEEKITKAIQEKTINLPIVILVNENTASSSEILSAAVRENNDNVTIVGKTTYGKGVIQTIFNLTDGSGIKLTTNEYYTPKRNTINKVGIKPDIEVEFPTYIEDDPKRQALRYAMEAMGDYLSHKSNGKEFCPDLVLKYARKYAEVCREKSLSEKMLEEAKKPEDIML